MNVHKTFADMKDGTSKTIVMSERCIGGGDDRAIRSSYAYRTNGADIFPQNCLNYKGPGFTFKDTMATGDLWGGVVGQRMSDPIMYYSMFNTVLPPNSPSCAWASDNGGVFSATSYHTGGVNVCWGDGSVTFASDTVNVGTQLATMRVYSPRLTGGASPFGVWGACGSINGGESERL